MKNLITSQILKNSLMWNEVQGKAKEILDIAKDPDVKLLLFSSGSLKIPEIFDEVYRTAAEEYTLPCVHQPSVSFKKVLKTKNTQKIIEWIVARQASNVKNCLTNKKYKGYLEMPIFYPFEDWNGVENNINKLEQEIELEKLSNLPKPILKTFLKKVWKDGLSDFNFDEADFNYLCSKFNINGLKLIKELDLAYKIEQEATKMGKTQLRFLF